MTLKAEIVAQRIAALKTHDSTRSTIINSILAVIKQVEVDTRKELDDNDVLTVLTKMKKQRLESIIAFNTAGRFDLSKIEENEIEIINEFLPKQLGLEEIAAVISTAITKIKSTGIETLTIKDMGKIMAEVKPILHGKAGMSVVSTLIKEQISK